MSEDRQTSRKLLRKQRDEELAHGRPFPLITLAEWRLRQRRVRIPLAMANLGLLVVVLVSIFLIDRAIVFISVLAVEICLFVICFLFIFRRYGICCPYCRHASYLLYKAPDYERRSDGDDRGRCPRCQRMIFTDWAKEDGSAATAPEARRSRKI